MTNFNMMDLILNKKLIYGCFENIKDVTVTFEEDSNGDHHFLFDVDLDTLDNKKVFIQYNKLKKLQTDFFDTNTLFIIITHINLIGEEHE